MDTEKLNEGMKAILELKEAAGTDVFEADTDFGFTDARVGAMRRRGLAGNALEDALYLKNDFGLDGKVVAGGAAADVIDDNILENAVANERRQSTVKFIQEAGNFGGLANAGAALFDDNLFASNASGSVSLPSDREVLHDVVADQILLEQWEPN